MSRATGIVVSSLAMAFCACLLPPLFGAEEPDLGKALAAAGAYKSGDSRAALMAAADLIQKLAKDPAQRKEAEKALVAVLGSAPTREGKEFACQQLSLIGSAEAVPALAKLLPDADLSHMARFALERMPAPEAAAALRAALGVTKGKQLAGVINSLGARRDSEAAPALAKLIPDPDAMVADAAISSLGMIGGPQATEALASARGQVPARLKGVFADAYLGCADQLAKEGKKEAAAQIYKSLYAPGEPKQARIAALRGLLAVDPEGAAKVLVEVLRSDDARMWAFAAGFAREIPGAQAAKVFADEMPKLAPPAQVLLLGALAERGDAAILPAVVAATKSNDEGVRVAGFTALGRVGDASSIALLAGVAVGGPAKEAEAARQSLYRLRGKEVDAAILQAAGSGAAPLRVELIRALAARAVAAAADVLAKNVGDPDEAVRAESLRALGTLADAKAVSALVEWLVKAKTPAERAEAEKAVNTVGGRVADLEKRAEPVLAALPAASPEARGSLLRLLGRIPTPKSLAAVRASLKDASAEVQDTAFRVLAEWPDAEVAPDLLGLARSAANPTHKVLALRGYIRVIGLPSQRPTAETVKMYADALAAATRADEKKQALGGLASVYDFAAIELATPYLTDKDLDAEAGAAVVQIAKVARKADGPRATAAVKKVIEVCKSEAARQAAENALFEFGSAVNIAPSGVATSPDGIDSDGGASGDQAAIDGNPDTYWDEEDNKNLYRLVVTFKQPEKISAISILGHGHHSYAPKDFDVLCDDKVAKSVRNAQYDGNFLVVRLDEVTCKAVELKITGYYGNSPAIRELGIYAPGGNLPKGAVTPQK